MQNTEVKEYAYAGFWIRVWASLIDGLILLIPVIFIPYIGGILVSIFYKPIFESSPLHGTPGKAIMGLSVLTEDGKTLSLKQAYIRTIVGNLGAFVLGQLFMLFTKKNQCLHDLVSGSIVVKEVTLVDKGYFDIWWDQIKVLFGGSLAEKKPMTSMQLNEKLKELHQLKEQGLITEQDYELKKNELLKKWS